MPSVNVEGMPEKNVARLAERESRMIHHMGQPDFPHFFQTSTLSSENALYNRIYGGLRQKAPSAYVGG